MTVRECVRSRVPTSPLYTWRTGPLVSADGHVRGCVHGHLGLFFLSSNSLLLPPSHPPVADVHRHLAIWDVRFSLPFPPLTNPSSYHHNVPFKFPSHQHLEPQTPIIADRAPPPPRPPPPHPPLLVCPAQAPVFV